MVFFPFQCLPSDTHAHTHRRACACVSSLLFYDCFFFGFYFIYFHATTPHAQQWQNFPSLYVSFLFRTKPHRQQVRGGGFGDDGYNHRSSLATVCRLLLSRVVVVCTRVLCKISQHIMACHDNYNNKNNDIS